jgi:hypothetical protein
MATFLMSQVVADARLAVQDLGLLATPRFTDAQILSLANQTLKKMAVLRPDLFALVTTMVTVQGAYQTAPADSIRLMEALLVVGVNNLNEINREALDLMSSTWQTQTPGSPTNWMRHPRNANAFFVYPPASAGVTLQIEYAQSPAFYSLSQSPAILPDAYYTTLLDGTVAALEMTDNEAANSGRAKIMNDMFTSQLQTSLQARATLDNESGSTQDGIASPTGAAT